MQYAHTNLDSDIISLRASLFDIRALINLIDGKEVSEYRKEDLRKALVASVEAYGQSLKSEADFVQGFVMSTVKKEESNK